MGGERGAWGLEKAAAWLPAPGRAGPPPPGVGVGSAFRKALLVVAKDVLAAHLGSGRGWQEGNDSVLQGRGQHINRAIHHPVNSPSPSPNKHDHEPSNEQTPTTPLHAPTDAHRGNGRARGSGRPWELHRAHNGWHWGGGSRGLRLNLGGK